MAKNCQLARTLGLYTQPLSLAGIPVISAPLNRPGELPIGIQFATARGREDILFELMRSLEKDGVLVAHAPKQSWDVG